MEISAVEYIVRLLGLPIAFALDPFAPVLVFGLALRAGLINDPYLLQPALAGFAGDGFLTLTLVLYVAHVVGDKIPPIAHTLDVIYLVLKPLAAAFVGFWMVSAVDSDGSLHVVALAVAVLGSITLTTGVHATRSTLRLAASAKSLGLLVPLISTIENFAAAVFAGLVIIRPELALVFLPRSSCQPYGCATMW